MGIKSTRTLSRSLAIREIADTRAQLRNDLGKALELLAKAEAFFKSSADIQINTYGADIAKFMDRMREKGHI